MEAEAASDLVRTGREALAVGDWERARASFERAVELDETAEALDGLAEAVHFLGDFPRAIETLEQAFAAYRRRGERVRPARLARWVAFLQASVNGNLAAANGWMARSERLLEDAEECAEHGWQALDRAPWADDPADRERHATRALELATRYGDRDLEFSALALLGETYVASGRVEQGMTMRDEAMAAVSGGEVVGLAPIGEIYCRLLSACEHAADISRAEQWMEAATHFVAWKHFVPPTCRLHYGGILIAIGRWTEAEEQLLAAIRVFEGGYRASVGFPMVRLAELRIRQGRLDEAERLLRGSEWHPMARRLLARVALARGDLGLAEDQVRLCLQGVSRSDPACAPLLELLVEVHLARGDPSAAREALEPLVALAASSDRVAAQAELAQGRVLAADGDDRAAAHLRTALERFSALDLPLEAARARLELARSLARSAPRAAVAEGRGALERFERLGAALDADRAAEFLRRLGAGGRPRPRLGGPLTKRETEVLSLLADGRSNAEIAARLYISRRTAEHHVASILSKLDLRSRAEAAAYAVRADTERPVGK
jgi:DNA-binding NarL/FixJ family response regulator